MVALARGYPAGVATNFLTSDTGDTMHWGFPLGVVYLVWVIVLVMLYPLSRWFSALKRRRRDWWLSYL